jgi:4-amino-4-deoxy-L-arabinose transferase-like glycosyltransferase
LASLGLFMLALLPRALGLGAFATADEAKWVYRSAQFLGALLRGDLAGTVVNLTPAVTTTWLGSLGLIASYAQQRMALGVPLADWLASLPEFRAELDVLVAVRWPVVLLSSLGIVALYQLGRRLVDRRVALLFGVLLALDPQAIALARVLGHDAPAGWLVGLSLLAFMIAVRPGQPAAGSTQAAGVEQSLGAPAARRSLNRWMWTLLSGGLAGLAWASKSPAFFLVPFVGLVALVTWWRRRGSWRAWLARLALWSLAAWLAFVLVWPAAWRSPVGMPYAVVHNAFLSATDAEEARSEGYWQVPDLGVWYYPVNGAFKLSVLASLGLVLWLFGVVRSRQLTALEGWMLAFALLFSIFMTLGGKRSNRYLLPAWPALYLLAALGLERAIRIAYCVLRNAYWLKRGRCEARDAQPERGIRTTHYAPRNTQYAVAAILAIFLLLPPLATYPYYLTYFNPLLGGAATAVRLVKIGWGEGLDQVGSWLNAQPEAAALRAGSAYASALAPFFLGKVNQVTAGELDYVVLYRRQLQEGDPSPGILRYYEGSSPAYRVQLAGIDYAWVYPGPAMQPALASEAAFDIGILPKPLAFRAGQAELPIGQPVTVEVLWLAEAQLPNEPSLLTLQPAADLTRPPEQRSEQVSSEAPARLERRSDGLVVSRHQLVIPADLPRGSYGLLVDGRPLGEIGASRFSLPPMDQRLDAGFGGQLRLAGYTFDPQAASLQLIWQAAPRAWADYTVFVHLVDGAGARLAGIDSQPQVPTSQWARGEVISMEFSIGSLHGSLPPGRPAAGEYHVVVGLYRPDTGERVPVLGADGAPSGDSVSLPVTVDIH